MATIIKESSLPTEVKKTKAQLQKDEIARIEGTREYMIGLIQGIQKGVEFQKKVQKYTKR